MTVHIALLRAINLGKHNKVGMAALRGMVAGLGLGEGRSLLQSGNLVFQSGRSGVALEGMLEKAAQRELGLETEFFVRSVTEWRALIADNPFPTEAKADPSHLAAMRPGALRQRRVRCDCRS